MVEHNWLNNAHQEATLLLKQLIATPSVSKEEHQTASLIESFLSDRNIQSFRQHNNVWVRNKYFNLNKPTILLNSHHDTVKPNEAYTLNPYEPIVKNNKLYGLGSNDAGASLVSLLQTFLFFYPTPNLNYNLIFAATAEEEISGKNGIESILSQFGKIEFAIVGEPTEMNLAIAEKGLLVLDCVSKGRTGHAALSDGDNAINKAMHDIQWLSSYRFPKQSPTLGEMKMTVTQIQAGTQHNVIPAECKFTVDIRCTDVYTFEEILDTITQHIQSEIKPRSLRLKPSGISVSHPFVRAAIKLGRNTFGSPTLSDQALIPFPSVKIGPGISSRSHQADEYIKIDELKTGIDIYTQLLSEILL